MESRKTKIKAKNSTHRFIQLKIEIENSPNPKIVNFQKLEFFFFALFLLRFVAAGVAQFFPRSLGQSVKRAFSDKKQESLFINFFPKFTPD